MDKIYFLAMIVAVLTCIASTRADEDKRTDEEIDGIQRQDTGKPNRAADRFTNIENALRKLQRNQTVLESQVNNKFKSVNKTLKELQKKQELQSDGITCITGSNYCKKEVDTKIDLSSGKFTEKPYFMAALIEVTGNPHLSYGSGDLTKKEMKVGCPTGNTIFSYIACGK